MSAIIDDGGPAFPSEAVISTAFGELNSAKGTRFTIEGGMSLRDYFAGQALAGVVGLCVNDARLVNEKVEEMLARKAFLMADAMLEARNKKQEDSE